MAKPMLAYIPYMQFFNNDGTPLSGGYVFIFQPGTTTALNTYPTSADALAGTNANPNPLPLNSAGRPSVDIYVTQSYKMVVCTTNDISTAIKTVDNIVTLGQLNATSAKSANYSITAADRDKIIVVDSSGGNKTITLLAAASAGDGFRIMIKKMDTSSNTITVQANAAELIDGANTRVLSQSYSYMSLYCDGTQWIVEAFKTFNNNIALIGGSTSIVADSFTLAKTFYTAVTITSANLASAASKILVTSTGSQQFKIRDIFLSGTGTNFSGGGGDRNLTITDNTSTWTIIPAATLQTLTSSRWMVSTSVPAPVTGSHADTASTAGTNIVAKYSGGTADYSAGSLTLNFLIEKIA